MVVCRCTGVTDRKILQIIGQGARTVSEITRRTGAGSCCQSCREDVDLLLSEALRGAPSEMIEAR